MGTIGIVVIILLVGVLNYKQAAETKMKKIETEENSVRENKTNYTNEQDSNNICELVKKVDFSSKEYSINWEIYTDQVELAYKENFYRIITNQMPLEYGEEKAVYFRDHLRGISDLDDMEFIEQFVKETRYRFIDCDGDGLPELLMDIGINSFHYLTAFLYSSLYNHSHSISLHSRS